MIESNRGFRRFFSRVFPVLLAAVTASADVVTLKTGEKITCTFLGATSRSIRVETGGALKTFDLGQIATISFSDDSPVAGSVAHSASNSAKSVISANTPIMVRVIDPIDSATARPGQTFDAATDEAIVVNGAELIPKDSPVKMRLVSESISVNGSSLTVVLSSVTVNGRVVPISSSDVKQSATSSGSNQEVARIGSGTSALAGIAGSLGAGRIVSSGGSAAGNAINTGNQLAVHGARVRIPAETRLIFRTQTAVTF